MLDLARLTPWLQRSVPGFEGPVQQVTKFDVGQSNPTYRLTTATRSYVLRRKPEGVLLKSAHAVDREFRVQKALADHLSFICPVHALCEDDSVIGSAFYVMDYVAGRSFVDPSLPDLSRADRKQTLAEMHRCLAAIHDIDPEAVGLGDFGPPGDYYARQLSRWSRQYEASRTDDLPEMDALIAWLTRNLPADDGLRGLVHGDFRLDNLLFAPDAPRCVAVLDWELSTLGHPFADVAGVIMQWQLPPGEVGRGLAGVDRAALGLPLDEEFLNAYATARQVQMPDSFGFYVAFAFFRMAAILQGVKKRALDGTASNPQKGLKLGAYIPTFTQLGLEARTQYG